jgi:hypothetical protein
MPCSTNVYRIAAISHGGTNFNEPTGGSATEVVEYLKNRPGTRKSPCIAINAYDLEAEAEWQGMITPVARGDKDVLTYTLENFLNMDVGTVACANMRAGAASFDFNTAPYKQRQKFEYDAGDAEDMAPITVSV